MALYENLPVYKAAYDLLLEIYKMNIHLTKEYRYTLGENLKKELTELLVCIYKANVDVGTKAANLQNAREHMVVIKLHMRMMHDLKQITQKRFVALSEKADGLSKQIVAWHKSAVKNAVSKNPESSSV